MINVVIKYSMLLLCVCLPCVPASAAYLSADSAAYRTHLDSAAHYTEKGEYELAAYHYSNGLQAYKTYYRNQLETISQHLIANYAMDKKEQDIQRLNERVILKGKQVILFTTIIIFLIITLILLYFTQRYHVRSVRQKRQQKENETILLKLEKEKQELEAQLNTLQVEKYQKELMAGALLVEYKNKVLQELRLFSESHPALNQYKSELEQIMTTETSAHSSSAELDNLQDIHPIFYAHLQKQADNKLTPLDLKYCRMIYLKMSSKEMADILHVDPKTIRVNKYRLKQKLGLGKEDDLDTFIARMA